MVLNPPVAPLHFEFMGQVKRNPTNSPFIRSRGRAALNLGPYPGVVDKEVSATSAFKSEDQLRRTLSKESDKLQDLLVNVFTKCVP